MFDEIINYLSNGFGLKTKRAGAALFQMNIYMTCGSSGCSQVAINFFTDTPATVSEVKPVTAAATVDSNLAKACYLNISSTVRGLAFRFVFGWGI